MKAHEVAAHILAKIDEIVLSGNLEDETKVSVAAGNSTTVTVQSKARERLKVYRDTLDSVNRYAANEPPEKPRQIEIIEVIKPG